MSPLYPSLDQVDEALWDKVQAINLKGPFRLSAVVGQRMADGDGSTILNISSVTAVHRSEGRINPRHLILSENQGASPLAIRPPSRR
jgi:NAD(P)-dependent dehydrogenase (short-subunit alcohol dehydrogenase family)